MLDGVSLSGNFLIKETSLRLEGGNAVLEFVRIADTRGANSIWMTASGYVHIATKKMIETSPVAIVIKRIGQGLPDSKPVETDLCYETLQMST